MRNDWRIAIVVGLGLTTFGAHYVLQSRVLAQMPAAGAQTSSAASPGHVEDAPVLEDDIRNDRAWAEVFAWEDFLDAQEAEIAEAQPSGAENIGAPSAVAAPLAEASAAVPRRVRGFNSAQLVDWLDVVVDADGTRTAKPNTDVLVNCPAPTAKKPGRTTPGMTRFDCAMSMMAASGSKVHRLVVFWADVQPDNNTQWYWEKYKFVVKEARKHGINQLILTPVGSPNWARRTERQNIPYGKFGRYSHPDINPKASHLQDWSNFITQLAINFKPTGFEIGNEENTNNFWDPNVNTNQPPSPTMYKTIYCAASEAIKGVRPHALVGIGGLAPIIDNDPDGLHPPGSDKRVKASGFVRLAFKMGIGEGACDVDFVAYHPYVTKVYCTGNPDMTRTAGLRELDLVHQRMSEAGHPDMKVWITEWGFPSRNYDMGKCTNQSEARQASHIRQEYELLAPRPFTAYSGYFNLVDDNDDTVNGSIGLLCSSFSPKPSYNTWRHLLPVASGADPNPNGCQAEF